MRKYTLEELKSLFIGGFDEPDPKKKGDKGEKETKSEDKDPPEDEEDEDDDETSDDDDDEESSGKPDTAKLTSALKKERLERKRLEKENKANAKILKKLQDKDKTEVERATADATEATTKATRLAERLKTNSVDTAIIKAAGKYNFADIDDVLKLINRDDLDVEQDEDDPSDVEIDAKSVDDALKALTKAKPHLVKKKSDDDSDDDEGDPPHTGSKFNRNGKKKVDETQTLTEKYPALSRRS